MKKRKPAPAAKPRTLTAQEIGARDATAIERIAGMDDATKLRNLMANADRMGATSVREAAFRRLADVQVDAEENLPGSVEHDFWTTIHAFEQVLKEERGKTIRLSRTRQKLARVGVVKTLADFADATKETRGFEILMERGLPDMTGEAVILRHPDAFDEATRDAATARLAAATPDPQEEPA